jgi:hypothetical protein
MLLTNTFAILFLVVSGAGICQRRTVLLDREDVWLLVMNLPEVIDLEARNGCPDIEQQAFGRERVLVLVRNRCPKQGNGSMGNYTVDLRDGRVWHGADPVRFVESERLSRLRKVLLLRHELRNPAPTHGNVESERKSKK